MEQQISSTKVNTEKEFLKKETTILSNTNKNLTKMKSLYIVHSRTQQSSFIKVQKIIF